MDFGDFPKLKYPHAYVVGEMIVTAFDDNQRILTGIRQDEPWKGSMSASFGGFLDPPDVSPLSAAMREVEEETGLIVQPRCLVGIYGPERHRYVFDGGVDRIRRLEDPADTRPVVSVCFWGVAVAGELRESDEQMHLAWRDVEEVAAHPERLGFDHARLIHDWYKGMTGSGMLFDLSIIRGSDSHQKDA